jgi:putative acetyltransferase
MSILSSPSVNLRLEQPDDVGVIRQINESAFGGDVEADLIDALRAADAIVLSVVAVLGGRSQYGADIRRLDRSGMCAGDLVGGDIVGHTLFSPVTALCEEGEVQLLGLGPVAVSPARQHRGIGTMMISGCLEHLRVKGSRGVVVVGEPRYYRRFGFIPASRWSLRWATDEVPEENLLALELTPGALTGVSGIVRYRPEFDEGA